jgi:hypothetical protein
MTEDIGISVNEPAAKLGQGWSFYVWEPETS